MGKTTSLIPKIQQKIERHHQWWELGILVLATITVIWGFLIPSTAIPSFSFHLGSGIGIAELALLIYPLILAALIQPASRVGEYFGQRTALSAGLGILFLGSLLCAFAFNLPLLFVGRIVQALGGVLVYPQLMILIYHSSSERERPSALRLMGWGIILSMLLGPLVGGILIHLNLGGLSWRLGMLLVALLAAVALLGAILLLPSTPDSLPNLSRRREGKGEMEYEGPALLLLLLLITVSPLLLGPEAGWPLWLLLPLALSPLLVLLFGWTQQKLALSGGRPLLHPALCLERSFIVGALLLFLLAVIGAAFFLLTLLTLQLGPGWSAWSAAITYLPAGLAGIGGILLAPRLFARWGLQVSSGGFGLVALGSLLTLLTIHLAGQGLSWGELLPGLLILGFGQGLAATLLIGEVLAGLRPQFLAGAANSMANTALVGEVVGVATLSVFFLATSHQNYLIAYSALLTLIVGLALFATALSFIRPALSNSNPLLEADQAGIAHSIYLLSGGQINPRIVNEVVRPNPVESKTPLESPPIPLGEFLAYHFEVSHDDTNWYRYLSEEAQTLGAGPVPQENERKMVIQQQIEEIRQRQSEGLVPAEFDPDAWRLMAFTLATCPHLLPQVTRLTTGHAPDTPEFRGLWGRFLRRLGDRISNTDAIVPLDAAAGSDVSA